MTSLTKDACEPLGVKPRDAERSKNFFALGLVSFMYTRPVQPTLDWIVERFAKNEQVMAANTAAFKAGLHFGETTEQVGHRYEVRPRQAARRRVHLDHRQHGAGMGPGRRRSAGQAAGDARLVPDHAGIRHPARALEAQALRHPHRPGRRRDRRRRAWRSARRSPATSASPPRRAPVLSLKSETISLAVSIELPMLIIDIQRGGPSTGLPTKTEAADLNLAMYGRHGEAPLPIVASYSPAQCFDAAIEAARIALKYRTPVILLSDGYLANGSEPWRIPDVDSLPDISVPFQTEHNGVDDDGNPVYLPYLRDPETLARPWAIPGTPGLMHRVGGLEKADKTGNVDYTPENHELMGDLRAAKIERIADDLPELEIDGDVDADICVLGWGSTWAAIHAAVQRQRRDGHKLAWIHLTHLNPLPNDLGDKLQAIPARCSCPNSTGASSATSCAAKYLVDAKSVSKVAGCRSPPKRSKPRSTN